MSCKLGTSREAAITRAGLGPERGKSGKAAFVVLYLLARSVALGERTPRPRGPEYGYAAQSLGRGPVTRRNDAFRAEL